MADKIEFELNPKIKFKFMDKEFEIEQYSVRSELLIILTGLMIKGKEYFDLMESLRCEIGHEELWKFVKEKFKDGN